MALTQEELDELLEGKAGRVFEEKREPAPPVDTLPKEVLEEIIDEETSTTPAGETQLSYVALEEMGVVKKGSPLKPGKQKTKLRKVKMKKPFKEFGKAIGKGVTFVDTAGKEITTGFQRGIESPRVRTTGKAFGKGLIAATERTAVATGRALGGIGEGLVERPSTMVTRRELQRTVSPAEELGRGVGQVVRGTGTLAAKTVRGTGELISSLEVGTPTGLKGVKGRELRRVERFTQKGRKRRSGLPQQVQVQLVDSLEALYPRIYEDIYFEDASYSELVGILKAFYPEIYRDLVERTGYYKTHQQQTMQPGYTQYIVPSAMPVGDPYQVPVTQTTTPVPPVPSRRRGRQG